MYVITDFLAAEGDVVTALLCDECGAQGALSRETRAGLQAELMSGAWPVAALWRLGGKQVKGELEHEVFEVCAACAEKREHGRQS